MVEGAAGAAEAAGLGEVFGLKRSASVFLAGEGEASAAEVEGDIVAVVFAFRPRFDAGSRGGSVVAAGEALATGEVPAVAAAFLRDFLAGEADASAAAAGEALLAGDASVAAAFLRVCLAGAADAVGVGDWALTRPVPISPITIKRIRFFMRMNQNLRKMDANEKHKIG